MTHQYGGDESSEFSYKLTDVLKDNIEVITTDPDLRILYRDLKTLWDKN